jgi:hypothetical protein
MDKQTLAIAGIAILLVVVLVNRANQDSEVDTTPTTNDNEVEIIEEKKTKDAMMEKDDEAMMKDDEKMMKDGDTMMENKVELNSDLTLSAESFGDDGVKLSWTVPEGLDESNRFIIVRGEKENPEHTGKNYWIRQSHLMSEATWIAVPTGENHFRICLTENNEKDACVSYSNDVMVNVE